MGDFGGLDGSAHSQFCFRPVGRDVFCGNFPLHKLNFSHVRRQNLHNSAVGELANEVH